MSNLQEYCSCDNSCNKECTYHCRRFAIYKSLPRHTANFQYRQLQLIWNTVRVPQSLYMGDLAALNVYQSPGTLGVNWNQMSDRRQPHVQPKLTILVLALALSVLEVLGWMLNMVRMTDIYADLEVKDRRVNNLFLLILAILSLLIKQPLFMEVKLLNYLLLDHNVNAQLANFTLLFSIFIT